MALAVIGLYFWPYFSTSGSVADAFYVSVPALIAASLTALASFVLYLWIPSKAITVTSFIIYALLVITTGSLIISTGGISSSFIALWMLVSVFAGIWGLWGLLPMLVAVGTLMAVEYLGGHLTNSAIITIAFAGVLPLIASFIIWHARAKQNDNNTSDRAYRDLASELTEVASKSEVVINAIGDGVMAIDSQGLIQLINPAAQQIIGWGKQDALALNYKSVLQLVDKKNAELDVADDPIQQVLNTNQQVRTNDLTLVTKSTKKIMVSLVVSPVGEVGSGVIVVFHDITKEKSEEREQAEFISTASHEMRTPVASIEGYLGLALNPATAQIDDKARDFIMKAHGSAQHLGRLFQDLLDVSKAEDGRLSNNPQVVDVLLFTRDIVQGLQQKATDKGLRLLFKPIPDDNERHVTPVYSVNLDNDHIREIINNLVENGIKYTPAGEVVVDVTGDNDHVVVSIKDSGIGIPAEDMAHLFQKFYRVDNKDTREIGGTGLGLYLCRRLAETLGGRIWAESEYHKGSTFYLELPRISSQEVTRLAEQAALQAQQEALQPAAQPVPSVATTSPVATPTEEPSTAVQPAQTVPRGESLTPEQIAAHVAQLKEMAQQQAAVEQQTTAAAPVDAPTANVEQNPTANAQTPQTRPPGIAIPVRDGVTPPQ